MTDEDSIRDLQRKWFQATMNGEVADIADLMTDDVVFLTPGRAPFGRQEFIDSFKAMKEHVAMNCDGEYTEIVVDRDLAYATARLDITVVPKNGGATKQLSGNALSVFKRLPDGKWRLSRDANLLTSKST
ncbi:MAG: SgcJ/EcaC family oxidoreductase [Planctomycetota bacterium]|nr:SgcJ/EcaC family oxidoreductase [Planctomycetota bacterium]